MNTFTLLKFLKNYSVLKWRQNNLSILCNNANLCQLARKRRGRFNFLRQTKRIR